MTDSTTDFIDVYDFDTAYQAAAANPGKVINFDGQLPSGYFATQKIVKVPTGGNPTTFAKAVSGSKLIYSSSQERGTHVIATVGELRSPTL
jgi:hypothetical protein